MKQADPRKPRRDPASPAESEKKAAPRQQERDSDRERKKMDEVDLASDYSFPASDPPAWTSGTSRRRDDSA